MTGHILNEEFISKNCTKEGLFLKCTTSKGLTEWFVAEAVFSFGNYTKRKPDETAQTNDKYYWKFHRGLMVTGKVLEVRPNELFKFTFGKKEPDSDEDIIVGLNFLQDSGNGTRIELKQENMADTEYSKVNYNLSCTVGWCYFLTNLRSLFESGFDLREKDKELAKESQDYTLPR